MHLTAINFAKKAKSRIIMVVMESMSSGHKKISFRDKQADKKEILSFDPYVRMVTVYKELKKVRTMRGKFNLEKDFYTPEFNEKGEIVEPDKRKRKIPTIEPEELRTAVL